MAPQPFRGVVQPAEKPYSRPFDFLTFVGKDALSFPQLLLLGAVIQVALVAILPSRYALLPALFFLLHTIVSITTQIIYPQRSSFMQGVVHGKVSSQLPNSTYNPDSESGSSLFGSTPAREPVVVLHLGVRINHPLGVFAPGAKEVADYFTSMTAQLRERRDEFGCIGQTAFRGNERGSSNTLLIIFYFRSLDGLHAFAHDKLHREAWDWFNKFVKKDDNKHIGIFHEAFCAQPGSYETIYNNMPPTLLGATNVQVLNEKSGQKEFVVPLVDAEVGPLRSQFGRMGKAVKENE